MNRKDVSSGKNRNIGVTFTELLAALAIIVFLIAVLFPVFQKLYYPPNGVVQDGLGKPLPNATLRFHDQTGRVVATVTADEYGNFRQGALDSLSHDAIDGFGLTRATHRTGRIVYTFTPLGTHIATFRDGSGKPVPNLEVNLAPDPHTQRWPFYEPFNQTSDKHGTIQVPNIPVGGRIGFLSQDPNYVIERSQATVKGNTVHYAVIVTKT